MTNALLPDKETNGLGASGEYGGSKEGPNYEQTLKTARGEIARIVILNGALSEEEKKTALEKLRLDVTKAACEARGLLVAQHQGRALDREVLERAALLSFRDFDEHPDTTWARQKAVVDLAFRQATVGQLVLAVGPRRADVGFVLSPPRLVLARANEENLGSNQIALQFTLGQKTGQDVVRAQLDLSLVRRDGERSLLVGREEISRFVQCSVKDQIDRPYDDAVTVASALAALSRVGVSANECGITPDNLKEITTQLREKFLNSRQTLAALRAIPAALRSIDDSILPALKRDLALRILPPDTRFSSEVMLRMVSGSPYFAPFVFVVMAEQPHLSEERAQLKALSEFANILDAQIAPPVQM